MKRFISVLLTLSLLLGVCLFAAFCAGNGTVNQDVGIKEVTYDLWDQPAEADFYPFMSDKLTQLYDILEDVSIHMENDWADCSSAKEVRKTAAFQNDRDALNNWAYGAKNFDFASYGTGITQAVAEYFSSLSMNLNEMADNLPKWAVSESRSAYNKCMESIKTEMAILFGVATQGDMPQLLTGQEVTLKDVGTLKFRGVSYQTHINSINSGTLNYAVSDEGEIFLVIEFFFSNESSEAMIESVNSWISAIVTYPDGHSYSARMLAEASNRSGISQMFFVDAGKTVRVIALVEVPEEAKEEVALVTLWFGDQQYKITL